MKRPTTNHFGGCSQMLVDGRQRRLDDTWCISKRCTHGACNTLLDKKHSTIETAKTQTRTKPPNNAAELGQWQRIDAR